jgi:hypothetical protein
MKIQKLLHIIVQEGSYICWPVYGCALHGDRCTADCEAHANFANESVCLIADNVWNYGKLLTLWTALCLTASSAVHAWGFIYEL